MVVCSRNMASLTKSWIILTLPISVFFISENYLEFFRLVIFLEQTTKTGIFHYFVVVVFEMSRWELCTDRILMERFKMEIWVWKEVFWKARFQILTISGQSWPFLIVYRPFCTVWPILTTTQNFWPFLTIFNQFRPYDQFWPLFHFDRYWPLENLMNLDHRRTRIWSTYQSNEQVQPAVEC